MSRFFPVPADCGRHTIFGSTQVRTYAGDHLQLSLADIPARKYPLKVTLRGQRDHAEHLKDGVNYSGHDGADLGRDQRGADDDSDSGDASALAAVLVAARRPTHDRPPCSW